MNLTHEKDSRDVIPVWRNFSTTSSLGELSKLNNKQEVFFNLEELKQDWEIQKSIGVAADLINAHFISNHDVDETILQVVRFIKNSSKPPKLLLKLSNSIEKIEEYHLKEIKDEERDVIEKLMSQIKFLIESTARYQISIYKKLTLDNPRNPINWVELSRLYTIEGNRTKSEKCILNALHLSPNNRYVLRCATRLFIENEKPEKAIYYLRNSSNIALDPWLTSAHIAVSSSINKFSPFLKNGIKQRESNKFTNFDLTELNSSLGTLELSNGNLKKAKAFFNDSLKLPNDNSLAQFQFNLNQDKRLSGILNSNITNVKNNYEALALKYRDEGNWNSAVENSLKWFLDVPYSAEPAVFSSYLLCTAIGDFETASKVCELALKTNPTDTTLYNNLIFSYLQLDKIQEAEKFLQILNLYIKFNHKTINRESSITALGTNALYFIKIGKLEEGVKLYKEAINQAKKASIKYYILAGKLNMTKELKQIKHPDTEEMIKEVLTLKLEDFKDLQEFRKRNFSTNLI
jgi:tetratricopeptide (TPR) repeat protein